jgi:hypothetical protein
MSRSFFEVLNSKPSVCHRVTDEDHVFLKRTLFNTTTKLSQPRRCVLPSSTFRKKKEFGSLVGLSSLYFLECKRGHFILQTKRSAYDDNILYFATIFISFPGTAGSLPGRHQPAAKRRRNSGSLLIITTIRQQEA